MRDFECGRCGSPVYFESDTCGGCGAPLGFDTATMTIRSLNAAGQINTGDATVPVYTAFGGRASDTLRYCGNMGYGVCNWLAHTSGPNALCKACDLNRTIPNLSEEGSLAAWSAIEQAKKRLVYSLLRFGLPFDAERSPKGPLTFDFMRDSMTGHLDGVVTIDIMEADSVERERVRQAFDEPYRSLLGHLRHETGHYYWMVLVEHRGHADAFRRMFGDERADYAEALARHHEAGPPAGWDVSYVSAYASSHPWEDWAETWAHYLHMVDAVDTAQAQDMEPRRSGGSLWSAIAPFARRDVYRHESFENLVDRWLPLSKSLNSLNRSMGHPDYYPFVIPEAAYRKLQFVHDSIRSWR